MMVAGAVGSLIVNIVEHGEGPVSLQWMGGGSTAVHGAVVQKYGVSKMIIVGVISFLAGEVFGIFLMALLIANGEG